MLSFTTFVFSSDVPVQKRNFTPAQRWPSAVVYNYKDGIYMIDSDSTDNDDGQWNVLTWMASVLQFLTQSRSLIQCLGNNA